MRPLVAAVLLSTAVAHAQSSQPASSAPPAAAPARDAPGVMKKGGAIDHAPLDAIVKKAVKGRLVDYDAVAKERAALQAYLAAIATADVSTLKPKDKLAFWTNAYNATVLNAVLEHGRPKSVLDVKGFFDGKKYTIAGEQLTLNELEEKKIRTASGDPRVHFAVNCASFDCPPLMGRAFTGKSWEADLERLTREFLRRPGEVAVDDAAKTVAVVQLFEWYQKDWGDEAKVRAFIAKYVPQDVAAKVQDPAYKLTYRPYDWRPNAVGTSAVQK